MSSKSRRKGPERTADRMRRRRSGPIEPVVIDSSNVKVVDRIHVFTIDDVDYTMDGAPSPALALRMLEMIELKGEEAAMSYAMHEVLGDEAFDALKNCDAITTEQFEAIMEIVGDHVMGALDDGGK